jgi:hypothetical protein
MGTYIVQSEGEPLRRILLHPLHGAVEVLWKIAEEVEIPDISNFLYVVVDATVVGRQRIVLCPTLRDDNPIEGFSGIGNGRTGYFREAGTEKA